MSLRDWYPREIIALLGGMVVGIILVPVAVVFQIAAYLLGIDQRADRSPAEVAAYLRLFIDGVEGEWDLDDFESVPIKDQRLEAIRLEFLSLRDWRGSEARELLSKAEQMAAHDI